MDPIIKWPGGKSREIEKIRPLIPDGYQRYVEPFFGGGALFFHLAPARAAVNDISDSLMQYYGLIKAQDRELHDLLDCYHSSFSGLVAACGQEAGELLDLFSRFQGGAVDRPALAGRLGELADSLTRRLGPGALDRLLLDRAQFTIFLRTMAEDKFVRTLSNHRKKPFSRDDLAENLVTGFTSGYYMYFRKVYNDIHLGRADGLPAPYRAANFYFIREYCYGSMFRYNGAGEFNIPYGGMSYNRKNLKAKIDAMFNPDMERLFANTELSCADFEVFLNRIDVNAGDFLFLDPPYDTDFSDYEGKSFARADQERLARVLKETPARFILVIKNTPFIHGLYEDHFRILSFDKQYAYNVRSRNDRDVQHLIITNLPV